jgi:hypothetical protein
VEEDIIHNEMAGHIVLYTYASVTIVVAGEPSECHWSVKHIKLLWNILIWLIPYLLNPSKAPPIIAI